jgi:hypothetical protein
MQRFSVHDGPGKRTTVFLMKYSKSAKPTDDLDLYSKRTSGSVFA